MEVERAATTMEFERTPLPRDADGYVEAFEVGDDDAAKAFFAKYGVVVFRDALSADETAATVSEVWDYVEAESLEYIKPDPALVVKRDDPETWTREHGFYGSRVGFLDTIGDGPAAWRNRENPRVRDAFASIVGTRELLASVDRFCLMRPTVVGGKPRPEWRTESGWLHWDCNPHATHRRDKAESHTPEARWKCGSLNPFITENNEKSDWLDGPFHKVQGVVVLTDSTDNSGGFFCVPGFVSQLPRYCAAFPPKAGSYTQVPKDATWAMEAAEKVTARAGSLIVWSALTPHCNYPVDGPDVRICQYLKMMPRAWAGPASCVAARGRNLAGHMPKGFTPSPVGKEVFGLDAGGWSIWSVFGGK